MTREHLIRCLSCMGNWEAWLTDHIQTSQYRIFFSHLKFWTRAAGPLQVEWGSTHWPENFCCQRMSIDISASGLFRLGWMKASLYFRDTLCQQKGKFVPCTHLIWKPQQAHGFPSDWHSFVIWTKVSTPCVLIPSCTEFVGITAVLRWRELEALWHVAVDLGGFSLIRWSHAQWPEPWREGWTHPPSKPMIKGSSAKFHDHEKWIGAQGKTFDQKIH